MVFCTGSNPVIINLGTDDYMARGKTQRWCGCNGPVVLKAENTWFVPMRARFDPGWDLHQKLRLFEFQSSESLEDNNWRGKHSGTATAWKAVPRSFAAQVRILSSPQNTGMYPLCLIHSRKGSWLHMGSNPIFPTTACTEAP